MTEETNVAPERSNATKSKIDLRPMSLVLGYPGPPIIGFLAAILVFWWLAPASASFTSNAYSTSCIIIGTGILFRWYISFRNNDIRVGFEAPALFFGKIHPLWFFGQGDNFNLPWILEPLWPPVFMIERPEEVKVEDTLAADDVTIIFIIITLQVEVVDLYLFSKQADVLKMPGGSLWNLVKGIVQGVINGSYAEGVGTSRQANGIKSTEVLAQQSVIVKKLEEAFAKDALRWGIKVRNPRVSEVKLPPETEEALGREQKEIARRRGMEVKKEVMISTAEKVLGLPGADFAGAKQIAFAVADEPVELIGIDGPRTDPVGLINAAGVVANAIGKQRKVTITKR